MMYQYKHHYILLAGAIAAILLSYIYSSYVGLYNQRELSEIYPTYITPENFTFTIWAVIYTSWVALGIADLLGKITITPNKKIVFIIAQIVSSIWLLASQYLYIGTSVIIMISLSFLLYILFLSLERKNSYFGLAVQLFGAWVFIATLVNIHFFLVFYNFYSLPYMLSLITLLGATVGIFYLVFRWRVFVPSFVFLWACIGIFFSSAPYEIGLLALLLGFTAMVYSLYSLSQNFTFPVKSK